MIPLILPEMGRKERAASVHSEIDISIYISIDIDIDIYIYLFSFWSKVDAF